MNDLINTNYINNYGLINAKIADINAENSPLWTMEFILISEDKVIKEHFLSKLKEYIKLCKTSREGLYHQSPDLHENKDDYTSPDQLIAFIACLKLIGEVKILNSIFKYLLLHLMTYNNLKPGKIDFSRIMQPAAVVFSAVCAGHFYLYPLLSLICIYSCMAKPTQTSGRLKAWTMMKSLDMKITLTICNKIIGKIWKSWDNVFKEYFKESENPIRVLIDKR